MQRTKRLDEIAWVAGKTPTFFPLTINLWKISIPIENYGKTPAIHCQVFDAWKINPNEIPTNDFPTLPKPFDFMILPNGYNILKTNVDTGPIRTNDCFYLYGTVWYCDVFGSNHWSQFCYKIPLHPQSRQCLLIDILFVTMPQQISPSDLRPEIQIKALSPGFSD